MIFQTLLSGSMGRTVVVPEYPWCVCECVCMCVYVCVVSS